MHKQLLIFGTAVAFLGTVVKHTNAQVAIDGTTNTTIGGGSPCNAIACVISDGTQIGDNLFHSFREFSLRPTNPTQVIFNITPTPQIENIIVRVTGGLPSEINGTIRVLPPPANLFFINPNGIILGENANLQLGNRGSFFASTASAFKFPDGSTFSATNPQPPSLTVNLPPSGLLFEGGAAPIINRSQALSGITNNSIGQPAGLNVSPNNTIALVGGNVTLDRGNITAGLPTAGGGNVEIGSVLGSGEVKISQVANGFSLDYSGIQTPNSSGRLFGDVNVLNESVIDASGLLAGSGGNIQIRGEQINVMNSAITSSTFDSSGGNVNLNASTIQLSGRLTNANRAAGIFTQSFGTGKAGNVLIDTQNLSVQDGASISARTTGLGGGGTIQINATNSVALTSSNNTFSAIESSTFTDAPAGNITINTGQLTVRDGNQIFASTGGSGNAGQINIRASSGIEVSGEGAEPSGIFTQVNPPATGNGGRITLDTPRLSVLNGGQISSSTLTSGLGGTIEINNAQSIDISGTGNASTGIFASTQGSGVGGSIQVGTQQLNLQNGGQISASTTSTGAGGTVTVNASDVINLVGGNASTGIFASTQGSGAGGNVNLRTNTFKIENNAQVSVSSTGTGDAGNINIFANSLFLNQGKISAETASGQGGNINLQIASHILMRNRSIISTTAGSANAPGDGGNITIGTPFLVGLENSDITSNSFRGRGGLIDITAQGVFGLKFRNQLTPLNDITAFSLFDPRLNGQVLIRTPDIDPTESLTEQALPQNPDLIAQGCEASTGGQSGTGAFINTGRGGIPVNPGETRESLTTWDDIRSFPIPEQNEQGDAKLPEAPIEEISVVEAQGWVWKAGSERTVVRLVSNSGTGIPSSIPQEKNQCGNL